MKIAIIPSIKEPYSDQFEYSIDVKLIKFIKKNFPKSEIKVLNIFDKLTNEFKLLIISGGNSIEKLKKSKKNSFRSKIDNKFFNQAKKNNIFILGICHGAQFLADKLGCNFVKKKHVGNHDIFFQKNKKVLNVNSYHNFIIQKFKNKNVKIIASAKDNSVEYFSYKKFIGIMWHPERNKKLEIIDKKILKDLLCN